MPETLYNEIPSLDLADFLSNDPNCKKQFCDSIGDAYHRIGFAAIRNHFLPEKLREKLYSTIKEFLELPDEVKSGYEIPGIFGQRGYTGKGKEHAAGRNVGDLKEFYHIGQELSQDEYSFFNYPLNVWPTEIPVFREVTVEAFKNLEKTGVYILRALAIYLDLPETYFDDKVLKGNSILRPIHYFPIDNPDNLPVDAVRAAAHGDINLITLLMGASAEGLEVLRRDGKWIPVEATPDQLVVNVGDMLERLTNNRLRSTIHRVVNPPRAQMNKPRYSIPFFMHPRPDMDLSCLSNCIDGENPRKYEDITAGEFLDQRLTEIGLKN